jgi:hypothetical protein
LQKDDFTLDQANDLARYFLGPDWQAGYFSPDRHGDMLYLEGPHTLLEGGSWRDLFRAAGVRLPLRPQYVARGTSVMFGATAICTAPSNTLAKRIAASLNAHIPDRRGI